MPTIHLMTGLPGSGKSTAALKMVRDSGGSMRRVNLDDLRMMMDANDGSMRFQGSNEDTVIKVQNAAILAAIGHGFDVVVDNTHLRPRLPDEYKRIVGGRAQFVVHDFTDVPLSECLARDAQRSRVVGPQVIRRMHSDMLKSGWRLRDHPMNDVAPLLPYVPNLDLPSAIICDIDGTLANMVARGPYDFAKVGTDVPNQDIAHLLSIYRYRVGYHIILLSGRGEEYRPHTEQWLKDHGIVYDELWMRAAGDKRPDDVIKPELFDAHVRDRFRVRFMLDDRNRVVDVWRRMGLQCWQVAPGDF